MDLFRRSILTISSNKIIYHHLSRFRPLVALKNRFVAGDRIEDAINAIKILHSFKLHATMDLLGEEVKDIDLVKKVVSSYHEMLDKIQEHNLNSNISLKPSHFGLLLDKELCLKNIKEIVEHAYRLKNFVRIDMEDYKTLDHTLDIFEKIYRDYKNVGIVLQAYLRRAYELTLKCVAESIPVRICKGAYKESPEFVYPKKKDVDNSYLKCAKELLINLDSYKYHDWSYSYNFSPVGIATHDEKIINELIEFTAEHKINTKWFEFQMLYGIRTTLQKELAKKGFKVRVYVPFGSSWYPYLTRRLAEWPPNLFFVVKNILRD